MKDEQEFRQRALEMRPGRRASPSARGDRPRHRGGPGLAMLRRRDSPAVREQPARPLEAARRIRPAAGGHPIATARPAGKTRPAERAAGRAGRRPAAGLEAARSGRAGEAAGGRDSSLASAGRDVPHARRDPRHVPAASPAGDVAGGVRLSRPADARPLPPRVDALGRALAARGRRRGARLAGRSR